MKHVPYWESAYMRCHHKQLAAWATWRPDLCNPDTFHVTISVVLVGKPNTSSSGCTHSSWKQDSEITLSLWPLSVPKQHHGTFKGDIHCLSFPCNLATLVQATLLTTSRTITSHLCLPVTTWTLPLSPVHLSRVTPVCSTMATPTTQHYHYHWLATRVTPTYRMCCSLLQCSYTFWTTYTLKMAVVSSFNMLVTMWLSHKASAKYFLKLMQQQSQMCNSIVSAHSHAAFQYTYSNSEQAPVRKVFPFSVTFAEMPVTHVFIPSLQCQWQIWGLLTFRVRMLHKCNAACSAQRPNVA